MKNLIYGFLFAVLILSAGMAAAEESRVNVYVQEFTGENKGWAWDLSNAVRTELLNSKCCRIIPEESQKGQAELFLEGSITMKEADDMFIVLPYLSNANFVLRDATGKEIFKGEVIQPSENAFQNDDSHWVLDTASQIARKITDVLKQKGYWEAAVEGQHPQPQPTGIKYEYR